MAILLLLNHRSYYNLGKVIAFWVDVFLRFLIMGFFELEAGEM